MRERSSVAPLSRTDLAPEVQVGPYHWAKTSTQYYSDHITTFSTYAYQARDRTTFE